MYKVRFSLLSNKHALLCCSNMFLSLDSLFDFQLNEFYVFCELSVLIF